MTKIFILGVGAQKAGTTWLHSQLSTNNNIDFGFRKEYHVFDTIEQEKKRSSSKTINNNSCIRSTKYILELHKKNLLGTNHNMNSNIKSAFRSLELAFLDNANNYFNYFDYLYLRNPEIKAVGDITPSYALLQPKTYRMIKKGLEARGFTIKILFLMRDPIERMWSAARMNKRNMKTQKSISFDEFNFMASNKEWIGYDKSRYEQTITNIENIFNPKEIYYGFYEELFEVDSHQKIQDFLQISLQSFKPSQILNASPKNTLMPEELNRDLGRQLQSTYEFMLKRYGDKMIKLWNGYDTLK